jgi:hypothetical protein
MIDSVKLPSQAMKPGTPTGVPGFLFFGQQSLIGDVFIECQNNSDHLQFVFTVLENPKTGRY